MARTHRYFAYGSNMNLAYVKTWLTQKGGRPDGIKSSARAALEGYRLVFNGPGAATWGGATANVVPDPAGRVEGVLLEVDEVTLSKLEQKDGVPRTYERLKVSVKESEGKVHADVVAFHAPAPRTVKDGKPTRKYLDHVLKGAEAAGLDAKYVEELRKTPVAEG